MHLINVNNLQLEFFPGETPPYAILSHTWATEEVTFQDVISNKNLSNKNLGAKLGWRKIVSFCEMVRAEKDSVQYAWVDTCCIDKTSSAELSEAINAMFVWYRDAEYCFAYLSDVESGSDGDIAKGLELSRWFTRGWTLQELLAPDKLYFFDKNWHRIGTRITLAPRISGVTRIDTTILVSGDFSIANVAKKMSWAANRQTTRAEDTAYCLLGLFGVSMPMLYGEGQRAFIRLQEEILKESDDHSIFAWDASLVPLSVTSIGTFASSPSFFKDSHDIGTRPSVGEPLAITNRGVYLDMPIVITPQPEPVILGALACTRDGHSDSIILVSLIKREVLSRPRYSRARAKLIRVPNYHELRYGMYKVCLDKRDSAEKTSLRGCSLSYSTLQLSWTGASTPCSWQYGNGPVTILRRAAEFPLVGSTWTIFTFVEKTTRRCFGLTVTLHPLDYRRTGRLVTLPADFNCDRMTESSFADIQKALALEEKNIDDGCLVLGDVTVAGDATIEYFQNSLMSLMVKLRVEPIDTWQLRKGNIMSLLKLSTRERTGS